MISDFPLLKTQIDGNRLVYLDSSNSSLTPTPVIRAMNDYYEGYRSNVHRALYPLSEKATQMYEDAREKIRRFLNAQKSSEIIFTRNATESINLVVRSFAKSILKAGDTVLLSIMEHHSNIVPWQLLKKEIDFELVFCPLKENGTLDLEVFQSILSSKKVKIVSLAHESNALGTINPIKEISAMAHSAGATIIVDGAQAAAHMKVDVQDLDADFYVCTGHKMCGPTGIGILYGKENFLDAMDPFLGGGDMIKTVAVEQSTWNDLPYKFEAGTPHIAGAIGLGAAIDYLESIGMDQIRNHEKNLLEKILPELRRVPGITIFGPQDSALQGGILSFSLEGIHPHDLATALGENGICVRSGHHCAQPLMNYLKVKASTRISFYLYTTEEDLKIFLEALKATLRLFRS